MTDSISSISVVLDGAIVPFVPNDPNPRMNGGAANAQGGIAGYYSFDCSRMECSVGVGAQYLTANSYDSHDRNVRNDREGTNPYLSVILTKTIMQNQPGIFAMLKTGPYIDHVVSGNIPGETVGVATEVDIGIGSYTFTKHDILPALRFYLGLRSINFPDSDDLDSPLQFLVGAQLGVNINLD